MRWFCQMDQTAVPHIRLQNVIFKKIALKAKHWWPTHNRERLIKLANCLRKNYESIFQYFALKTRLFRIQSKLPFLNNKCAVCFRIFFLTPYFHLSRLVFIKLFRIKKKLKRKNNKCPAWHRIENRDSSHKIIEKFCSNFKWYGCSVFSFLFLFFFFGGGGFFNTLVHEKWLRNCVGENDPLNPHKLRRVGKLKK